MDRSSSTAAAGAAELDNERRVAEAWRLGYLTAAREVAELLDPAVRVRSRRGLGRLLGALLRP